jgi:hypothetical protein
MRPDAAPIRILALTLGLVLVACGGSGGTASPDGAAGAGVGGSSGGGGKAGGGGMAGGGTAGGGQAGGAGTSGAAGGKAGAGGGGAGVAGGAGAGGAAGSDAGGTAGRDAGGPESGPADGAGGASGDSEGGAPPSGPCAAIPINTPEAQVTNIDNGKTVDASGFTGGALPSGTYVLTSVVHFGASYTGPTREIWVVDAAAKTLEVAALVGTTPSYISYTISNASPSVLSGVPVCGATAPSNWNYLTSGAMLSVNPRGSNDVKLFTKQQ